VLKFFESPSIILVK